MAFENIKQLAKQYTYSHKVGKNIDTFIEQAQEYLLKDDIVEYEKHLEEVNKEIRRLQDQKNTVFSNFWMQSDELKNQYLQDINNHISFLKDLQKNYEVITSWVNPMKDALPNLSNNIKDNVEKINRFVADLNALKSSLQQDSTDAVDQFKQSIKDCMNEEKEQVKSDLHKYAEGKQKELDSFFEEEKNKEHNEKQKRFWNDWVTLFAEMQKEWLFSKYLLVFGFIVVIIVIDYLMIWSDFSQMAWINRNTDPLTTLLYQYILPFWFSLFIILLDILTPKVMNEKWSRIIKILIFVLCFVLLAWPVAFMLRNEWDFEVSELLKIGFRFLIYFLLIPVSTNMFKKYVVWKYLKIWLSNIAFRIVQFFKKLFSPITRLFEVIARFCRPLEIKSRISLSKFGIKFDGLPQNEFQDTINLSNTFSQSINSLENQITHIKNYTQAVVDQFQGGNEILNVNIENLRKSFSQISEMLDHQFNQLREKRKLSDGDIDAMINRLAVGIKQKEENLKDARMLIKQGVLEAVNENKEE